MTGLGVPQWGRVGLPVHVMTGLQVPQWGRVGLPGCSRTCKWGLRLQEHPLGGCIVGSLVPVLRVVSLMFLCLWVRGSGGLRRGVTISVLLELPLMG